MESKKRKQALAAACRFLVKISDNNDISAVPYIADISSAYSAGDSEKIVGYLKDVRKFTDQLINDLEQ